MSKFKRVKVERVMSPDQATKMVGDTVQDLPGNVEVGTIFEDADTGEPLVAYLPLEDPAPLRRAVTKIDTGAGLGRQKNYRSASRTFGYTPRRPIVLREGCTTTTLARDHPDIEETLERYADQFSATMMEIDPELVEEGQRELENVLPEWRMGEAKLWTSGVVNDTAQLPYHRDGFNFPTWSAMPVVRRGVRGGGLHLPEYDIVLPCADSTVTYFAGWKYVHGVTPLHRVKKDEGYRISVVYYALKGMKNCREYAEEQAYARQARTKRESDMAKRLAQGDRSIPGAIKKVKTD